MNDRHLDDAIDHALREMMSVDAPSDVRMRVLSRIGRSAAFPISWLKVAVGASLAAAAVVVVVLALRGFRHSAVEPPGLGAPSAPVVAAATPHAVPTEVHPERRRSHRPRVVVATAAADTEEAPSGIAPLATPEPIEIVSIESEVVAPPMLSLVPLAPIAEVFIEPLSAPKERN